ncbi:uncharacterized protein RCC_04228 [Ramularia collo-cygni]|uniref:Uncharacterized protein n=1 Tax=Ramularia collo-cygni TaxID=112498 RepID=A0A2D3V763_9PEZI|nr:uncharacterized protein RCC_04228 [Ramularia collo-cygni]CZT18384.1 uncharacterized protein RCC_04228 [Ramularia collo-cygni]
MHASTIFALAAATFASAAPVDIPGQQFGSFEVSNFIFGCTSGCNWYFDVSIAGSFLNHPAIDTPVHCEGGWALDPSDVPSEYVECGPISQTQSVSAYVTRAVEEGEQSVLNLVYSTSNPLTGAVFKYYGDDNVYSATGYNASLQQSEFSVPETSATAVI